MIKLIFCLQRRSELSPSEFYAYWVNDHGPKVRSLSNALRIRRYVPSHTCSSHVNERMQGSRGLLPGYDGAAEVWWESEADRSLIRPAVDRGRCLL